MSIPNKEELETIHKSIPKPFGLHHISLSEPMKLSDLRHSISGVLTLFGATFGIGCLGLPAIMAKIGIINFFMFFGLGIVINYASFESLIYFADRVGLVNFVEISKLIGGKASKAFIMVFFFLVNAGNLLAAMAVYNKLLCNILSDFGFSNKYVTHEHSLLWLVVPAMAIFPLLLKRKLKGMEFMTYVSLFAALYLVFFLFFSLLKSYTLREVESEASARLIGFDNLSGSFGYLFASLASQNNLMSIYNEMPDRSVPQMKRVLTTHLYFFFALYGGIGFFGYMIFYSDPSIVSGTVLDHFSGGNNFFLFFANVLMIATSLNALVYSFKPIRDTMLQLIKGDSREDVDNHFVDEEKDFEPLNITVTLMILCLGMMASGYLTLNSIGFLDILDFSCSVIVPVLYVFIPLATYLRQVNNSFFLAALLVGLFFYCWKLMDYFLW